MSVKARQSSCHYCKRRHEPEAEYFCTECRQTFCDAQVTTRDGEHFHRDDQKPSRVCGPVEEMPL